MGSSVSRPSPLAPTFARMASWDMKAAKQLLADYKEKDLDFGLDAQALAELCGGDNAHAEAVIDAFGGTNGIVNALAYICGAILVSSGAALEKAGLVFDALDFDMTEQITMDEMTIVLLCCARGFCVMSATGTVPSDEALENVTLQAYRELSKSGGHSITKAEFTKWALKFVAAAPTAVPHAEVSLDDMAVQFGLVAPPPPKSLADEVLSELAADNNAGLVAASATNEVTEQEDESKLLASAAFESQSDDEVREAEDTAPVEARDQVPDASESLSGYQEETAEVEGVDRTAEAGEPVSDGQEPEYTDEFQAETPRVAQEEVQEAQEAHGAEVQPRPASAAHPDASAPVTDPAEAAEGEVSVHEPQDTDGPSPASGETVDMASSEAASNGEQELASDAPWDPNAYDTYDYTDAAFDMGSGLPPPDPHEQDALDESEPLPAQDAADEPTETTAVADDAEQP